MTNARRTDRPRILRPNSFQGNAYEITPNHTSGAALRDINGLSSLLGLVNGPADIGSSIHRNSEPMLSSRHRQNYGYVGAVNQPCAANYQQGTLWVAFKRLDQISGFHEIIGTTNSQRLIWSPINGNNIRFRVNGSNVVADASLRPVEELNVLSYSWGSNGYSGYLQGDRILTSSVLPTGNGPLLELTVGLFQGTSFPNNMDLYSVRVLPIELSDAEQKLWADDIWLPYRKGDIDYKFYLGQVSTGISSVTLSDNIDVTDPDLMVYKEIFNLLTDNILLADVLIVTLRSTAKTVVLSDDLLVIDNLIKFTQIFKILSENTEVSDALLKSSDLVRQLSETLNLDDSLLVALGKVVTVALNDSLSVSDEILLDTIRNKLVVLLSNITVSDDLLKSMEFLKLLNSDLTVSDDLIISLIKSLRERILVDNLSVFDSLSVTLTTALIAAGLIKFDIELKTIVTRLLERTIDTDLE